MIKDENHRSRQEPTSPSRTKPAGARLSFDSDKTAERLDQESICDEIMKDFGFRDFQVRREGQWARIEVAPEEIDRLFDTAAREAIVRRFKEIGFSFVSLDLQEYRAEQRNERPNDKTD